MPALPLLCCRYRGQFLLSGAQLPSGPKAGPAVWVASGEEELTYALAQLLRDPVERRSRGQAAAQVRRKAGSAGLRHEGVCMPGR